MMTVMLRKLIWNVQRNGSSVHKRSPLEEKMEDIYSKKCIQNLAYILPCNNVRVGRVSG
jgi:hypothetical protein